MTDVAESQDLHPHSSRIALSARLRELTALFLKLGVIGFGGPAAHIAMIEGEIVLGGGVAGLLLASFR